MTTAAFAESRAAARPAFRPVEVGAWTLEYLGPGFRVQLRVTARAGRGHISGWMSPALAARVFLVPVAHPDLATEAVISQNGRFEYEHLPSGGGYRLAFLTDDNERPFLTPPFWV